MTKTRSRSALLALDVLGRIVRGELQPGDAIDLQALEQRHRVSRTVVREALADLGGKGLVVARPKVGTLVAPDAQWNLLDPMLVALAVEHSDASPLARDALALRTVIEPAIASAAARCASRQQIRGALDALRAMDRALSDRGFDAWCDADAAFHEALAEGCGNRLLRSIDRSLAPVRATQRRSERSAEWYGRERPASAQRTLAEQAALGVAVARRDATLAASIARRLAARDLPPAGTPSGRFAPALRPQRSEPLLRTEADGGTFLGLDRARREPVLRARVGSAFDPLDPPTIALDPPTITLPAESRPRTGTAIA